MEMGNGTHGTDGANGALAATAWLDAIAVMQEAGEVVKAMAEGEADGQWTEAELQRAIAEVEDVLNKATEVRRGLDEIKARAGRASGTVK